MSEAKSVIGFYFKAAAIFTVVVLLIIFLFFFGITRLFKSNGENDGKWYCKQGVCTQVNKGQSISGYTLYDTKEECEEECSLFGK